MIRAALGRFSGRSRSAKPPRVGPMLEANRIEAGPDSSRGVILYLEDITVSFDGFQRAQRAHAVHRGRRAALHHRAQRRRQDHDDGCHHRQDASRYRLAWFGQTLDLLALTEPEIAQAGIGRKFQKPTVFEDHTVFENLRAGAGGQQSGLARAVRAHYAGASARASRRSSSSIGSRSHAKRQPALLAHGQKQWLEIGMLLAQAPQLLLVDEPVAGMTHAETERTAELLLTLAGEHTVVVVEHDMEFVRTIASR